MPPKIDITLVVDTLYFQREKIEILHVTQSAPELKLVGTQCRNPDMGLTSDLENITNRGFVGEDILKVHVKERNNRFQIR